MEILDTANGGHRANVKGTNGAAHVMDGFKPSSYTGKITTDGVGVTFAIATGAKRILFQSLDITAAEWVVGAFGTSAANAVSNLNVAGAIGTTGFIIGSNTNTSGTPLAIGVPSNATHCALVTGVNAATQVVMVTQGV